MQDLRVQIDLIDKQIVELLQNRFEVCKKIGEYKKQHSLPILNEKREKDILNSMPNEAIIKVYEEILKQSRLLQE